jgi:hypothetical protein
MTERRFPPQWSVEEQVACFIVTNVASWLGAPRETSMPVAMDDPQHAAQLQGFL